MDAKLDLLPFSNRMSVRLPTLCRVSCSLLVAQKFEIGLKFKLPGTPLTDKPNGGYIGRRREDGRAEGRQLRRTAGGTGEGKRTTRKRRRRIGSSISGMTQMLTRSLSAFERADMSSNAQGQRRGEQEGQAAHTS